MSQIEEIKRKIDIVKIIGERVPLKKAGRNYKALCPFHSEKTPSFMVSPQLQIFKCFGCGEGGDVIKFLQLYEKMDFWEAVEYLAQRAGVKLKRKRLSADERLRRRLWELNREAAEFYHFLLTRHPQGERARLYLRQRGIKPSTVAAFKIGFSPLDPSATVKFLQKKGFSLQEMLQSGIVVSSHYRQGQFLDRFRGRLVFPLHDHRGNIIGFSGRIIPGLFRNEDNLAKYINSPETFLYHKGSNLFGFWLTKEEVKKKEEVFVVEGELDMISPWQIGVKNIVALKGTAFTEEQIRLLKRFVKKIIITLDEDAAGNAATLRGIRLAEDEGLEVEVLTLKGKFKDPDEAAQKDPKFFLERTKKTLPVWDFVIDTIIKKYKERKGKLSINDKKNILGEALPFLVQISNEIEKDFYLHKLARRLQVSPEAVLIEAEKVFQRQQGERMVLPEERKTKQTEQREVLEGYLLGLVFTSRKPEKYLKKKFFSFLKTFHWQRIFKLARQFVKKRKFSPEKFLEFLPPELKPHFEEIFFRTGEEEKRAREIKNTLRRLKLLTVEEKLAELVGEIALAEKKGEKEKLKKLSEEFTTLSRQRVELKEGE